MTEYLFSNRELGAVIVAWLAYVGVGGFILGDGLLYFGIPIGGSLLAVLYMIHRSKTDKVVRKQLGEVLESPFWDAYSEFMQRFALGGILFVMLLIQMLIANEALSQQDAEVLASLITISGFDIGLFTMVAALIAAWIVGPMAVYFITRGVEGLYSVATTGGDGDEA
jgi:uncharacterized membrane protein